MRVFTYFCLALLALSCGVATGESFDLYTESVEITGDGSPGPYRLPRRFLLLGKEEVYLEGTKLKRGEDYAIDYTRGEITFEGGLKAGLMSQVRYQFFPFWIEESYQNHKPPTLRGGETEASPPVQESESPAPQGKDWGELAVVGSRSLGVSFGSGMEPSLNQSLKVNINGRLSQDVSLKAALSDQENPILPEGTTERLSELDKVFVQVSGSRFSATLGDCDLTFPESDFGPADRRLEGAILSGETSWGKLSFAGARAEGEFATYRISGVEGKQGPYELKPDEGAGEIVVVPGSERVWLDGELLIRGENNDYTIDYSTGEITFTHRRLITRDSRILVDFEYSTGSYRRSLFSTSTGLQLLGEKVRFGGTLFKEGDDPESALGFDLTEERRTELSEAGDTTYAWVEGGVCVGSGKGSYVLADSIYEWVGYGNGDYSVSFTQVEGGDYEFDPDIGGYRWVGTGQGDYVAKLMIPLPSQLSLLDLVGEGEMTEGVKLRGEWAGSLEDMNALSPGREELGEGRKISLSLDRWEKLFLEATYSHLEEGFSFPGRFHAIEYEERWEAEPGGSEILKEIEASFTPVPFLELEGDYGRMDREGSLSVSRRLRGRLGRGLPNLAVNYDRLNTAGGSPIRRSGGGMSGEHRVGRFQPRLSVLQEQTTFPPDSGRWYREIDGEVKLWELGALSAYLGSGLRWDDILGRDGEWVFESRTATERLGLSLPAWRGASLRLDLSHRDRSFGGEIPGEDMGFDLASFRGNYYNSDLLAAETSYEISNEERRLKQERFEFVGEGKGSYSRDPNTGEYYPDEEGDYRRVVIPVGKPQPITRLCTFLRTSLSPSRFFSVEGAGYISEETREADKFSIYLLDLSRFQRDETTIFGERILEIEPTLYPGDRVTLGGRWTNTREADNRINVRHMKRDRTKRSLHVQAKLTPRLGVDLEVYQGREVGSSSEYGEEKRESSEGGNTTPTYTPFKHIEFSLGVGAERRRFREPYHYPQLGEVRIDRGEVLPKVVYSISRKGRLWIGGGVTERASDTASEELPPDISSFHPPGLTTEWSFGLNYQLSRYLTSNLTYRGENRPDRDVRHSGEAEMRAYF